MWKALLALFNGPAAAEAPAVENAPVKAGDTLYAATHGVARVEGPVDTPQGASWLLKTSRLELKVPTELLARVTRPLVDATAAQGLLDRGSACDVTLSDLAWEDRFREYSAAVASTDPDAVVRTWCDLELRRRKGDALSFAERKVHETTLRLLAEEIATVLGLPEETVRARLQPADGM